MKNIQRLQRGTFEIQATNSRALVVRRIQLFDWAKIANTDTYNHLIHVAGARSSVVYFRSPN